MANFTRSRERGEPLTTSVRTITNSASGGVQTKHDNVSFKSERIDDVVTPDFTRRINSGEIINNDCTYVCYEESLLSSSYQLSELDSDPTKTVIHDGGNLSRVIHEALMPVPFKPAISDEEKAKLKARSKLRALSEIDNTPYAFGEPLGELRSTIKFIGNPLGSLVDLVSLFRKDVFKTASGGIKLSKAIASVWAQYHWAAAPLLRTVVDAYDAAIQKVDLALPERLTARGFADSENSIVFEESLTSNPFAVTYFVSQEEVVNYHAAIHYIVENPVRGQRYKLGLRAKDFPDIAWQLTTLSFMVDRLIDIRSSIRALSNLADPSVKILAASTTERRSSRKTYESTDFSRSGDGYTTTEHNGGLNLIKEFSYTRERWSPRVSDAIAESSPKLLVADTQRVLDLLAVILLKVKF